MRPLFDVQKRLATRTLGLGWAQVRPFGSIWGLCWAHVGAMLRPCWAHVGPCWAHVGLCGGLYGAFCVGKISFNIFFLLRVISGLVSRPGTPANKNMGPRLGPGAAIWIHLGFKLGPCWGHVGPMLRPCWGHVGAMLGHEGGFMG